MDELTLKINEAIAAEDYEKAAELRDQKTMNVLWLDDASERTKIFRSYAPYATFTETAQQCIDALSAAEEPWDIVFLDHDLGGEIYVDTSDKNTGSEVVRWICQNQPKIHKIVVHSCNSEAAKWMVHDLLQMDYYVAAIPIPTLLYEKVDGKELLEVILEQAKENTTQ